MESLSLQYLKNSSSILGYSLVPIKIWELFIIDKLDVNVLFLPNRGYDVIKRIFPSKCRGLVYIF
jgi:hypothetical protein